MPYIILAVVLFALILGPQLWVRHILTKYSTPQSHIPGSGGELAEHLIKRFSLDAVTLEETQQGDHYDPAKKAVRLSPDNFKQHSLTAIATAAHEVGHAIQDHEHYSLLKLRGQLIKITMVTEKIAAAAIIIGPIFAGIAKAPTIAVMFLLIAVACMAATSIVHLITLPVEWDASFNKALPILEKGNYINEHDLIATRKILTACALTYLSASLASLLNVWRWLRILRR